MRWEASRSRFRSPHFSSRRWIRRGDWRSGFVSVSAEGFEASGAAGNPGAALFIFARAPEGGPPVAVIRETASAVPGEFSLSDANNMLPGRSLADFEALTIVARISASGQPTEQPGDVYGEILYTSEVGSGIVELVIDRIAQ